MQIIFNGFFCRNSKGYQSFFFAFPKYADKTGCQVTGGYRQGDEFCDPQTCGVKKLQHAVVAHDEGTLQGGRGEQSVHNFYRQCLWQGLPAFGDGDKGEGVGFYLTGMVEKGKKTLQGREASSIAAVGNISAETEFEKSVDACVGNIPETGYFC